MRQNLEAVIMEDPLCQTDLRDVSETALVTKIREGDPCAFEALFHRYKRKIYSLCYRLINDIGDAEDLTQEIFLHLFRNIASFRGESLFSTWFHRLAVNIVLMYLRRKRVPKDSLSEEHLDYSAKRTAGTPDLNLNKLILERAIAELPHGYRTILILHDLEGYDHQEVAELLGCSVGTSKSQLHKARMKLREILRR